MRWRKTHHNDAGLPLIVPLVFYHGAEPWPYQREFAELFSDAAPQWRWVPRFEYLLATQPDKHLAIFAAALRRNVPGRGGDVMNYMQQLIERGRREGTPGRHSER